MCVLFETVGVDFVLASIVFWNTTNIDPDCFGQQTAANMDLMKQRIRRDDKIQRLDDVRKVSVTTIADSKPFE